MSVTTYLPKEVDLKILSIASTVIGSEEKSRWVRIGAAWHKDGSEYILVQLDALPVNDELVLQHYKPDEKKADDQEIECLQKRT